MEMPEKQLCTEKSAVTARFLAYRQHWTQIAELIAKGV
jgi:hypothetical protein